MRPDVGSDAPEDALSDGQKRVLLQIARESVAAAVRGVRPPSWDVQDAVLREKRGAFVTLKKHGELRGCIGYIEAVKPLWETVADVAASAAINDYRFPAVGPAELDDLDFEISVLTPLRPMKDPSEIVIGKHGLLVCKENCRGLLLPQVAVECRWDKDEFLDCTCRKAGLRPGEWQDPGAETFLFSAEVFGDSD